METYIKADSQEIEFLTQLRHRIHSRPCLSGNEKETADIVSEVLQACSPDALFRNIGGHGIIALFKGNESAPSVLFRCELDALPIQEAVQRPYMSVYDGVAHCCGHDGHAAIMCGLARWIASNRAMLKPLGNIYILFQGEEETGAGARKMADWMKEKNIVFDYALALHNWPSIKKATIEIYPQTYAWASVGIKMDITGHTSHASEPWEAANPTDAIIELIERINSFNSPQSFSTVISAAVGELDFGITPGKGYVATTTRSRTDQGLEELKNKILKEAASIVEKHRGLSLETSFTDYFPATMNSGYPTSLIKKIAEEAGYQTEENFVGTKGSDDFCHIANMARRGATFFDIGSGENHAPLHRPDFDFDDDLIPVGLDVICRACLQILQSPQA